MHGAASKQLVQRELEETSARILDPSLDAFKKTQTQSRSES